MCPHCRAFITTDDKVCPYCNEKVGPRAIDRRSPSDALGGLIPHARFTTALILTINIGLYIATALYSMRAGHESAFLDLDGRTLLAFGAKLRYEGTMFLGQWWRLVTAGFLHGGLLHIAMNSWVLFDLGAQVEEVYGTARMIVFYFAGTVLGFAASLWWSPALSVGASAGIFGLIGAMIALGVGNRHPLGSAIRSHYVRWTVYMLIFGLLPGIRVDNAAHIGGLVAGFGLAYASDLPGFDRGLREKLWRGAAYVCVLLTGFSFLRMFIWFTGNLK